MVTNVFRHADLDATCAIWQRTATKKIQDRHVMLQNAHAVKETLVEDCVNVLYNYRKFCATNSSSGQLILPESLKLLPLYTLATVKSRALRYHFHGMGVEYIYIYIYVLYWRYLSFTVVSILL